MTSGNAVSGLLTGKEIRDLNLVDEKDFDLDCLQAASYDLRLGDKHFLFEDSGTWKAVFLGEPSELNGENDGISDPTLMLQMPRQGSNKLIIPPFGSAIIQLKETIDLLSVTDRECGNLLIAGRFDLKLKTIYKGLISQQATQVEPCYKGKLYCFVHNLSSNQVVLSKDDKIATIEFSNVGTGLDVEARCKIILETISYNKNKFNSDSFTPSHTGIEDIRWLHTVGMLPEECGIAPIYKLVQGNIREAVDAHLEKSDIVDKLADRVGNKLSEKQNAIKIVLSLVAAVITFFTTGFLMEVMSELRYFSEELSLLASQQVLGTSSLNAILDHTSQLAELRNWLWICTLVAIVMIVGLLLILFFVYMRPMYEQRWHHKKKSKEAQFAFRRYMTKQNEDNNNLKILHCAFKKLREASRIIQTIEESVDEHCPSDQRIMERLGEGKERLFKTRDRINTAQRLILETKNNYEGQWIDPMDIDQEATRILVFATELENEVAEPITERDAGTTAAGHQNEQASGWDA